MIATSSDKFFFAIFTLSITWIKISKYYNIYVRFPMYARIKDEHPTREWLLDW
jgi:hypothetical protein